MCLRDALDPAVGDVGTTLGDASPLRLQYQVGAVDGAIWRAGEGDWKGDW